MITFGRSLKDKIHELPKTSFEGIYKVLSSKKMDNSNAFIEYLHCYIDIRTAIMQHIFNNRNLPTYFDSIMKILSNDPNSYFSQKAYKYDNNKIRFFENIFKTMMAIIEVSNKTLEENLIRNVYETSDDIKDLFKLNSYTKPYIFMKENEIDKYAYEDTFVENLSLFAELLIRADLYNGYAEYRTINVKGKPNGLSEKIEYVYDEGTLYKYFDRTEKDPLPSENIVRTAATSEAIYELAADHKTLYVTFLKWDENDDKLFKSINEKKYVDKREKFIGIDYKTGSSIMPENETYKQTFKIVFDSYVMNLYEDKLNDEAFFITTDHIIDCKGFFTKDNVVKMDVRSDFLKKKFFLPTMNLVDYDFIPNIISTHNLLRNSKSTRDNESYDTIFLSNIRISDLNDFGCLEYGDFYEATKKFFIDNYCSPTKSLKRDTLLANGDFSVYLPINMKKIWWNNVKKIDIKRYRTTDGKIATIIVAGIKTGFTFMPKHNTTHNANTYQPDTDTILVSYSKGNNRTTTIFCTENIDKLLTNTNIIPEKNIESITKNVNVIPPNTFDINDYVVFFKSKNSINEILDKIDAGVNLFKDADDFVYHLIDGVGFTLKENLVLNSELHINKTFKKCNLYVIGNDRNKTGESVNVPNFERIYEACKNKNEINKYLEQNAYFKKVFYNEEYFIGILTSSRKFINQDMEQVYSTEYENECYERGLMRNLLVMAKVVYDSSNNPTVRIIVSKELDNVTDYGFTEGDHIKPWYQSEVIERFTSHEKREDLMENTTKRLCLVDFSDENYDDESKNVVTAFGMDSIDSIVHDFKKYRLRQIYQYVLSDLMVYLNFAYDNNSYKRLPLRKERNEGRFKRTVVVSAPYKNSVEHYADKYNEVITDTYSSTNICSSDTMVESMIMGDNADIASFYIYPVVNTSPEKTNFRMIKERISPVRHITNTLNNDNNIISNLLTTKYKNASNAINYYDILDIIDDMYISCYECCHEVITYSINELNQKHERFNPYSKIKNFNFINSFIDNLSDYSCIMGRHNNFGFRSGDICQKLVEHYVDTLCNGDFDLFDSLKTLMSLAALEPMNVIRLVESATVSGIKFGDMYEHKYIYTTLIKFILSTYETVNENRLDERMVHMNKLCKLGKFAITFEKDISLYRLVSDVFNTHMEDIKDKFTELEHTTMIDNISFGFATLLFVLSADILSQVIEYNDKEPAPFDKKSDFKPKVDGLSLRSH